MTSIRHSWSDRHEVSPHRTERVCWRCGTIKVTRHEFEGGREQHWQEFWRDKVRIKCEATPPCDARLEAVAA